MGAYSIKDLERLSGIKAHTIRIWEKRYGLIDPTRTPTNIRTYSDAELKKLLNISILNRNGLKVSKIAELTSHEISSLVTKLTEDSKKPHSQLENLYLAMIDLDEIVFEKILSRSIIQLGFENMVIDLLYPFFKRIGVMWQTGTVSPAQEHFISNLVRQKLVVAIDSMVVMETENTKSFILFLPENEWHELGLLFMNYILKKRGHHVSYLGCSLPIESLESITKLKTIDYLVTSIVGSMNENDVDVYVKKLAATFPDKGIYLTGAQVQHLNSIPENVSISKQVTDFVQLIDEIS